MKRMQRLVVRVLLFVAALCTCAGLPLATYAEEPIEGIGSQKVVQVALGASHSAAITEDGSLWMWGENSKGQLGDGTYEDRLRPVKVMDNVKSVALGRQVSAAILNDGTLWLWGSDEYSRLGNGDDEGDSPIPQKLMDDVVAVSLGGRHSAAIKTDGTMWMWGSNVGGMLGDGTVHGGSSVPTHTPTFLKEVASTDLGDMHSAAITVDGELCTWGVNHDGQLGFNHR